MADDNKEDEFEWHDVDGGGGKSMEEAYEERRKEKQAKSDTDESLEDTYSESATEKIKERIKDAAERVKEGASSEDDGSMEGTYGKSATKRAKEAAGSAADAASGAAEKAKGAMTEERMEKLKKAYGHTKRVADRIGDETARTIEADPERTREEAGRALQIAKNEGTALDREAGMAKREIRRPDSYRQERLSREVLNNQKRIIEMLDRVRREIRAADRGYGTADEMERGGLDIGASGGMLGDSDITVAGHEVGMGSEFNLGYDFDEGSEDDWGIL